MVPNVERNLQERLDSITQQILSETRLLKIMDSRNLYPKERKRLGSDQLVERMRKDIQIELVRSDQRDRLTSFNIYYLHGNPVVAQQVTDALTRLFSNK